MSQGVAPSSGQHARVASLLTDPSLGATQVEAPPDTTIYDADSPAENISLIESGQVRLFQVGQDGGTRLVSILGKGDWLGLTGLGGAATYGMRAVTVTATSRWNIEISRLNRKIDQLPPLASEMILQLACGFASRTRRQRDWSLTTAINGCSRRWSISARRSPPRPAKQALLSCVSRTSSSPRRSEPRAKP